MGYRGGRISECFPVGPTERAARKMADKGGEIFTKLTVEHTPIDTGHLRQSWKQKVTIVEVTATGHVKYVSGVETDVEYAPYVEHGTGLWGPKHAKYLIEPKIPGGVLHWVNSAGEDVFAARVMHPGSPGAHMVAQAAGSLEALVHVVFAPELEVWKREYEDVIARQKL